ncbi:uncharacterized protein VTP21DRAFT_5724 [Calcarisporiella thermophila]|uniref:uncharacterized protein n=1 Tax=Calcarisporiella thermophila TaxID=911321 RepID=UPI003744AD99
MNLELLDPFDQDFPDVIEEEIPDLGVRTCAFNRWGTLLAAGCASGACLVWDFDTHSVARQLIGHVRPVTSLSWSRNGRYLLTGGEDMKCIFWDLVEGRKRDVRFGAAVSRAVMHPRNNFVFAASLFQEAPVLVELSDGRIHQRDIPTSPEGEEHSSGTVTTLCFDLTGERIYTGNSRGFIYIIDVATLKVLHSIRITTSGIKQIHLGRRGRDLAVNANDRIIRVFSLDDEGHPHLQHKFQDLVSRTQWSQCGFSADDEYVIGGSAHKAEHSIYIWDRGTGILTKILQGPKDPLEDVAWHPSMPVVASVTNYGDMYLWGRGRQQSWSAFAPDFEELEENIEYEEREDEFDVVPEVKLRDRLQMEEMEREEVDVTTIFHSFEGEGEEDVLLNLPAIPEEDVEEEEGGGTEEEEEEAEDEEMAEESEADVV